MELLSKGIVFLVAAILGHVDSLFVPEQLPTLLSFIYTNIPPIRKGIDSRVGFGFRLGPNADVQVMLELGPQQNTAPVGPQKADANSKRETRLPQYKYRGPVKGSWLHAWKQQQTYIDDGEDVGVMPMQPALDRDVLAHLHQLYKEQPMPDNDRSAKALKPQRNPSEDTAVKNPPPGGQPPAIGNSNNGFEQSEPPTIESGSENKKVTEKVTINTINSIPT